eukprot:COSAG02_NODE_8799_length_2440_cov_1.516019_3_plen_85_part_00
MQHISVLDLFCTVKTLQGEIGCQAFPDLRTAQAVCSDNPKCGGLTEYLSVQGKRVFETRSGPNHGDSPAGERCHLKIRTEGSCR